MSMRFFRHVFSAACFHAALAFLLPAQAADISQPARAFVQSLGDTALGAANDRSLSETERNERFRLLFSQGFEVPAIARFVLGKYWRLANDEEKSEFLVLFEDLVIRTFATHFKESGDSVRFQVGTSRFEGENHAMVTSQLVLANGKPPVKIDWRVLAPKGVLKVVDVLVEGVSMSVTQQEEFSSLIQRQGGQVSSLLRHLRAQNQAKGS